MTNTKNTICPGWNGNIYTKDCPNVSTTPIMAMGCRQCLPLSVVQLKGKHCRNGVVDTLGHCFEMHQHDDVLKVGSSFLPLLPAVYAMLTE